jgi:hypothetical protein
MLSCPAFRPNRGGTTGSGDLCPYHKTGCPDSGRLNLALFGPRRAIHRYYATQVLPISGVWRTSSIGNAGSIPTQTESTARIRPYTRQARSSELRSCPPPGSPCQSMTFPRWLDRAALALNPASVSAELPLRECWTKKRRGDKSPLGAGRKFSGALPRGNGRAPQGGSYRDFVTLTTR